MMVHKQKNFEMADEPKSADLSTKQLIDEPKTIENDESISKTNEDDGSPATAADLHNKTNENLDVASIETVDNHAKYNKTIESSKLASDSSSIVQKPRKTYENRKNNETASPEVPTTSSPPQNTSRYGRARKPKITEDFYNIEDIFGPYERITSASPRKKSQKLELSPNKNKESVNLQENKSIDLNSVLSINIPDDNSIEVSKVMKIVSNNSEFSPKSPSYSSKSVKVYENKNKTKKNSDYAFLNGFDDETSDSSSDESVNKSETKPKTSDDRLFIDESFNNTNESLNVSRGTVTVKRTKIKSSFKKKLPDSEFCDFTIKPEEIDLEEDHKNKKLNKLQKDLNIGELKSGRLRSSIADDVEIIKEILHEEIDVKSVKKQLEVITIDDAEEIQESNLYLPDIGDLAWSRVGSYPFWPSIVTNEPGTSRHFKSVILGRKNSKCYHVHFFGDNGRRSWVLGTHIFPFHRRSDLEVMAQSVSKDSKPKDPKHLSAFIINPNKLKKWETAVTEAESITATTAEMRIQKFFDLVNPKKKGKKRSFPSPKSPKNLAHKKIKLEKKTLGAKKYQKKKKLSPKLLKVLKIKSEDDAVIKSPSPLIKEEPLDEKTPKAKQKLPKHKLSNFEPDKVESKRKFPKTADDSKSEDSFSESDNIIIKQEIRDTPSPQSQISVLQRHKRINLFRGITKDRVCQICGRNKNVYKCKGNCFGLYHIECDKIIRQKVLSRKIEDDSDSPEETIINRRDSSTNSEKSSIKSEENDDTQRNVSSIVDEILQNVFRTMDNNLKTEEENEIEVKPLSIAEQIDLKMEEVMKNLMTETKYTDSTTDEGSENEEKDPFQLKLKSTQSTSSESGKSDEYSHLPTGEATEEIEDSKQNKTTRKVIKHVTADGIFDVIEETSEDYSSFKCAYCSTGYQPPCFICNKDLAKSGDDKRHKCVTPQCGKHFHSECLKDWPQTKWNHCSKSKKIENETLSCPYHNCHTCISDDPRGPLSRYMNEKLSKCIRCPTTYHSTNYCIPAGTEILSTYQLICPKHLQGQDEEDPPSPTSKKPEKSKLGPFESAKKPLGKIATIDGTRKSGKIKVMQHVNASWCFICSMGGSLICCETCPSSFHVECLKLVPPEGRYLCEECESGRLPLYDEIVWVKLGAYRWWPAQILYPADIPPNVASISHTVGEFVVRFFGSHDHYWVNRGRVFLFQEGDTGHASSKKSAVDGLFVKAIEEATRAHKKFVEERANRAAEARNGMKPPSYIKIKVNRPVGNVRSADADTSNTTPCDCDPNWDQPCGPDSDCLNRILLTECNPMVCAAGSRCCNQSIEKRLYAPVAPFKTTGRGWGLKTMANVKKGAFVIEYVGEVIDEKEYQRRMKRKHEQKDENYYFLTIDKDRMIDAGPKGNVARFMNHSCNPNCETQKWTINGDTRVGLFAIKDIQPGSELTFNYNLECIGEEKKECRCGAPNCSGFIGVKAKQDEVPKKRKSVPIKQKKKKPQEIKQTEIITCFICGESDAIQSCDRESCNKFYHLHCASLETFQEGKWLCPWHSCNFCTKRTTRCCFLCINSYCPLHSEGNIRYDRVKGFVCTIHDIKEEEEIKEVENLTEITKTKESLKIKKTKKQLRISQSEIRSSTESSKNIEEMAEKEEIEAVVPQNEENDEPKKSTSRRSSKNSTENRDGIEELEDISSVPIEDSKEKKPKPSSRKSTKNSQNDEDDLEEKKEVLDGEDNKKINKTFKENKNGAITKPNKQIEEIDILKSSEETAQNNNITPNKTAIKKRKSRLSLKQIESSNSASNSSQDDDLSEDEKPLVSLKKIKLEEISPTSFKTENKIEDPAKTKSSSLQKTKALRSDRSLSQTDADLQSLNSDTKLGDLKSTKKPTRSLSLTDFDSSGTSEADFVFSPKKTLKKMKMTISEPESATADLQPNLKKLKKINDKIKTVKNNHKENTPKAKKQMEEMKKSDTSKNNLKKLKSNEKIKKPKLKSSKKEESKFLQEDLEAMKSPVKLKKFNLSLRKVDTSTPKEDKESPKVKLIKPNLSLYKAGMRRSIRNLKQYKDMAFSDDECDSTSSSIQENNLTNVTNEATNSSIEDLDPTAEETKPNSGLLIIKKQKTLSSSLRKSLRGSRTDDNSEEETQDLPREELDSSNPQNENVVKRKRGRPRNDEKYGSPPDESTEASSLQIEDHDDAKTDDNTAEIVKRKRGRPRKTLLPSTATSKTADHPDTDTDSERPKTPLPVVKRPIGRPRKQKNPPEEPKQNIEHVTELYKLKISETIPKNPYENHVNEVKLTANVPERHLRVVLRKHSEIDTKIDNKFLKMQNDIERDLPIRKRSKLRYEAQLENKL